MLEVNALSKSYRGLPAIDNVSFRVGAGEIVGYVGPNGSGKSTTVKIVTGLLEPSDGQVLFEGESIRNNLQGYRDAFGYVPEEAHVYTHLSGLEYLQFVGRLRNMPEALIELKANRFLSLLGLESWRYSPISLYSKGMKQRVLIAAALLHDPKLLIFDEPLSGLDVVSAQALQRPPPATRCPGQSDPLHLARPRSRRVGLPPRDRHRQRQDPRGCSTIRAQNLARTRKSGERLRPTRPAAGHRKRRS